MAIEKNRKKQIQNEGAVSSSFLAELAGALDILRCVMERSIASEVVGVVQHYCDNESVVKLIQRMGDLTQREWRERACRHLWSEMGRRLQEWRRRGGVWTTQWVKGHVDAIQSRDSSTYTVVEKMNIAADKVADTIALHGGAVAPEMVTGADEILGGV